MDVADHSPHGWYLVRDGEELLLDVNVSWSAFSFDFVMKLSDDERATYEIHGRDFLGELAQAIQDSGPTMRDTTSPYRHRNITSAVGNGVSEAIRRYREARPPES